MKADILKKAGSAAVHAAEWLPSLALLACAAFILRSHTDNVNHTWIWAALLQIAAAVLLVPAQRNRFCPDRRTAVAAGILTVLFLILLSVKELIAYPLTGSVPLRIILILSLFPACFLIICRAVSHLCGPAGPEGEERSLSRLRALLVIEGLCFLFAEFPFRPAPDAADVYQRVIHKRFSDWHTIGYHLYVWFCITVSGRLTGQYHPFLAVLLQTVFWFVIFFRAGLQLRRLYGQRAEKNWLIANAVMFIPLFYLGMMYKDVIFSMFLLGLCGELLYLLSAREHKKTDTFFLVVYAVGASVFRHAMVEVVAVALVVAIVCVRRLRKKEPGAGALLRPLRMALAFALGCFILLQAVGTWVLKMEKNPPYVKYTVPLFVCGNIVSTHPELLEDEDKALLEEIMPLEKWKAAYESNTYLGDKVARRSSIGDAVDRIDNALGMKIIGLNARILLRSPGAYLNAVTRISSIVWQVARPQDGYEWSGAGHYWRRDEPDATPSLISEDTGLKETLEIVETGILKIPGISSVYYRGGFWVFLLALVWAVLILKRKARLLPAFLAPLLVVGVLMLSCPAQDSRYVLPLIEIGMLGAIAARYVPAGERPEIDTAQTEKV